MKKLSAIFLFLLSVTVTFAQDVIIETSGTRTEAKILTVNDAEIAYKRFSNPNGPTYTKKMEKIARIEYENGDVDDFGAQRLTESNVWGDTTLLDIDYESYRGFLLAPGNVVYIPDGRTEYEKAAVQYLRERIYNDKFWVLASRKEQAHFLLVYEVVTKGRDHIRMVFLERRDPYTDKEIDAFKVNTQYGRFFWKYGHIRTSESVDDNMLAVKKLYGNILEIQETIVTSEKEGWYQLFMR